MKTIKCEGCGILFNKKDTELRLFDSYCCNCRYIEEQQFYKYLQENQQHDGLSIDINQILNNLKSTINSTPIKFSKLEKADNIKTDADARKFVHQNIVDSAVVSIIYAGYGSKYDSEAFLIAFTDDEIDKLLEEGKIIKLGNYF